MPEFVVISLGGCDYNNQGGNVPSNETFTTTYNDYMLRILNTYSVPPKIAAICGMGDPTEPLRDPDNIRCSPCPHVQDAVNEFKAIYSGTYDVEYFDIPCDGSVVTGYGDIGCSGHKNSVGQAAIANHIIPPIKAWLGW